MRVTMHVCAKEKECPGVKNSIYTIWNAIKLELCPRSSSAGDILLGPAFKP